MKALSVRQPWADLIVTGQKAIETRSWRTAYRGRLLIHASRHGSTPGAIVGEVTLIDCIPVDTLSPAVLRDEAPFGDFSPGRFAWLLRDAQQYATPIPARGRLGLWTFDT